MRQATLTALALAAAGALLPTTASADSFGWTEQAPGTYTRTVKLDGGKDYALVVDAAFSDNSYLLTLSLAGKPLAMVSPGVEAALRP